MRTGRNSFARIAREAVFAIPALLLSAVLPAPAHAQQAPTPPPAATTVALPVALPTQYDGDLRALPQTYTPPQYYRMLNEFEAPPSEKPPYIQPSAPLRPNSSPLAPMPASSANFAGIGFSDTVNGGQAGGGWPPDTNGDVGPTYYIQSVNTAIAVFNKTTGARVVGFTIDQLWSVSGTTTPCLNLNDGDPIVMHDARSDRWILTDFAFGFTTGGNPKKPFYQCIAVSKTSDPVSGGWYFYAIQVDTGGTGKPPSNTLNDYPKFGLWNDGCLYMGANGFNMSTSSYAGAIFASFSTTDMYAGSALTSSIGWLAYSSSSTKEFALFPADLLGSSAAALPPAGTPAYFVAESSTGFKFNVRKFTPGPNCGAGGTMSARTAVSQASYPSNSTTSDFVPQKGTSNVLDSLEDRLMQRVQYRKVGSAESLWVVHTVGDGSTTPAQSQWAQINVTGGTISTTPVQQQIFAPDTTKSRWMASLAVDKQGNMAMGYSLSSASDYPGIFYAGRLVSDVLNDLPQSETALVAGGASQNNCGSSPCSRWGDYSSMTMDPVDDCTFWYTTEYYDTSAHASNGNWQTRIGSFKFPGCGVVKQNQTITFPNPGPLAYSPSGTFALTATASSGLAVTYASTTPSVCSVSGSTATMLAAGTCTIKADQAGNATYNAAPTVTDNITINKANQTITFTSTAPVGAIVGGATYTVTASGGASGNAVTFAIDASASTVCSISGNTVSFTTVGNCVIDANQAGNANYNAAPQAQQSFSVGKGNQTIAFPNPGAQTYGPGGTFAVGATATSGLAVTFTSTTPAVCTVSGTTVTIQSGGTCTIKADQAGNANYNAAPSVSDNITINPASQTIAFPNPGAQTYSPTGTFAVSATATSGLAVTFTSTTPATCTVSGTTVTILAAGTCTIDADQSGNASYSAATTVADNITINPASQTITFTSTAPTGATVGGTYSVSATGGASGNPVTFTIDVASGSVCTISGSLVTFTATGSCLIDANQAGSANYAAATQAQQAVSLGLQSQTITFPNPGPVTYSLNGTFALTSTGGASGNPVTYVSNSTGICTVSGSTATIVSAGTCSITASQAGNATYGAASPVTDLVTIAPASQSISFTSTPPASPAIGGTYAVSATGGASGNPVTFSIDAGSTAGACSISGPTVSFSGLGTCIVDADQAGNANYTAAPQAQQSFTIGLGTVSLVFTTQPADVAQGTTVGAIAVTEQNQFGYVVASDNSSTVDFSVADCSGSGSVSLGSATMSNGVATLANSAQRFYTLTGGTSQPPSPVATATSSGNFAGSVSSDPFNVIANADFLFADGFESCRL